MRITSIEIKNFRSIGSDPVVIKPSQDLNIFIGCNNVGKTNILSAIHALKEYICDRYEFTDIDWHKGQKTRRVIEIHAQFALDAEESDILLGVLTAQWPDIAQNSQKIAELREALCKHLQIEVNYRAGAGRNEAICIRLGFLYIHQNQARLVHGYLGSYQPVPWGAILELFSTDSRSRTLQEVVQQRLDTDNKVVELGPGVWEVLVGWLDRKLRGFPEIRQKPLAASDASLEAFGGTEIPSVLLNLSTSETDEERNKYEEIRRKFSLLFPGLEIVSVRQRDKNVPDVHVIVSRQPHYEVRLESTGTGVIEMMIFLTNLIGSRQRILFVEEPELHLHPHAQRLLFELLQQHQTKNQLFVITHSPYFIDTDKVENQIVVNMGKGVTRVTQLPSRFFSKEEKAKLAKSLSYVDSREIMFSNAVLLVEGDTERNAMPIFAQTLRDNGGTDTDLSFDKNTVSVVAVGSKNAFGLYMKLLAGFQIPYLVMCDADAILEITAHIRFDREIVDTSALFAQLALLKILDEEDKAILRECGRGIQSRQTKHVTKRLYGRHLFKQLKAIAEKHDCIALDADFLDVIKNEGHKSLIEDAKREVGMRSDARIARYVASSIPPDRIPVTFVTTIERIVDKARKRVQSQVSAT